MRNKIFIPAVLFLFLVINTVAQNNTYSPYSRYGLGELNPTAFAHNAGMGGANIAWRPDSTIQKNGACQFINPGNPASYPHIRLTSLEVGGRFLYSQFKSNTSALTKWNTHFSYATLGFPIRGNGGAVLGIAPFSHVGYDVQTKNYTPGIGDVNYVYNGSGSINKAFIGYGIMPFNKRLQKFRKKNLFIADSTRRYSHGSYMAREALTKIISDISLGFNVNYIFGNVQQTSRVIYPNSILFNNSYRSRILTLGDFTGNFGIQTAITIDSVNNKNGGRRALKEKVKIVFGFFSTINNPLQVNYDAGVYNYIISGSGQEIVRDTVLKNFNQKSSIVLPLENGFGVAYKKGERLNLVADFAITNWQDFKYIDEVSDLKKNYRIATGINYVPEKEAAGSGAYFRKMNYRFGLSYNTGYIHLNNTTISNYAITAGLGLPVGIGQNTSMVNVALQYGQTGTLQNNLVKENYWRVHFGFTFSDRWFQKFRYD